MGILAANTLAGALTAAVTAAIRREAIPEAFLKGAVGGSVVFTGKRLAAEHFDGAGLLGRELAAVGSSIVGNGGAGRGWLEEVWLPIGPAWIQVSPEARQTVRLNIYDVGAIIWAARQSELEFDWARTVSTGTPVFVAPGHRFVSSHGPTDGVALGGVILLSRQPIGDAQVIRDIQRHETVHVIQRDFDLVSISRPIEAWAWSFLTDRSIPVDVDLSSLLGRPSIVRDLHETEALRLEER